ncbi:hypothetical protein ACH5RR_040967 [Cinchona calisaya]|uniref:Retrotransposon gag domain-containing protein n=1 Tax=Cinchona calisaya TaxID=153742 RepID=A0ABD2XXL2_9GENT
MDEFYRLEQRDQSVVQYAFQLQRLGEYVPAVWRDEQQRMYHFRKGLRADLRRELIVGRPQTYEEMYNLAIQLDSERGVRRDRDTFQRGQSSAPAQTGQTSRPFQSQPQSQSRGQSVRTGTLAPPAGSRRGPSTGSSVFSSVGSQPQRSQSVTVQ